MSLLQFERPIVIDADGLNVLAGTEDWWESLPHGRLLLTPHMGELARLLDTDTDVADGAEGTEVAGVAD